MFKKLTFACSLTAAVAACGNPIADLADSIDVAGMALENAEKQAASVGGKAVKVVKGEATKLVIDAGVIAGAAVELSADSLPAGVESAILKVIPAPASSFPSGDQNFENQGPAIGVTLTNAENGEKVKLASAATVTVPLAEAASATPDQMDLAHYSDDGNWEMLDGETSTDNTLSGKTDSFSTFGAVITQTTTTTVDTVAPDTTVDSGPANESTQSTASSTFTFSCNESDCTFECKVDTGSFAACTSPFTTAALEDGARSFSVRARDAAGNVDATPAARFWNINTTVPDTTAPVSTLVSGPAQSSYTTATSASFGLSCDEGSCGYFCKLDNSGFTSCTSPKTVSGLSDGMHTFYFYAQDGANNAEATPDSGRSWTVDTVAPVASILTAPEATTDVTTATVTFSCTDATPCALHCKLDDANYTVCTSPKSFYGLANTNHTFHVKATDAAVLTSTVITTTWTTAVPDTTAPQTTIISMPLAATSVTTATFTFSASEEGTFECKLDAAELYSVCLSPANFAFLEEGEHTFMVRATDLAENTDETPASFTWNVDWTLPMASITTSPTDGVVSATGVFEFNCGEDTCTFVCKLDDEVDFAPCTSPKSYTGASVGSHYFFLKAIDAAGNVSSMVEDSWWNTTVVP